ncbi:manganese catalase family protein [Spirosoma litoris]
MTGVTKRGFDPVSAPLADATNFRNTYHAMASGQGSLPMDSMGNFWMGQNVFSNGNLKGDQV